MLKSTGKESSTQKRFPWYGWLGLVVMLVAEVLLFARVEPVPTWFTPVVWSGYILFADGLVLHLKGQSLIHDRWKEFLMMCWLSLLIWLGFELYNLRLMNWYYVGLPAQAWQRDLGYGWAFATIFPAIFESAEWLEELIPFQRVRITPRPWREWLLALSVIAGFAFVAIPPMLPYCISRYLFGFVWLGFIFLVDPINRRMGAPSLLRDWEEGHPASVLSLLASGVVCGLLWEFWNYWAHTKWIYAMPLLSEIKLFEMPVLGFLGFPPFALECYVLYQFAKTALRGDRLWV